MTDQQQASVHDQLANRYLQLTEQIEDLQAQRDAVKDAIRKIIGAGSVVLGSGVRVSVTPNRRLDLSLVRSRMSPEQLAACTIEVLSNPLIKKHVAPDVVEQCMVEVGDPIVRVN